MTDVKSNGQVWPSTKESMDYTNNGYQHEETATTSSDSDRGPTLYHRVHIEKPQMDQVQFDDFYSKGPRPKMTPKAFFSNLKEEILSFSQ